MMLQPTSRLRRVSDSTYPPRERWVLDAPAYKPLAADLRVLHTHLVRGGFLMLQPTSRMPPLSAFYIPTS